MSKPTKTGPANISRRARALYARRDQSLDDAEVPQLSPAPWASRRRLSRARLLKAIRTGVVTVGQRTWSRNDLHAP